MTEKVETKEKGTTKPKRAERAKQKQRSLNCEKTGTCSINMPFFANFFLEAAVSRTQAEA